jgi:hypothetical protein
VATQANGEDGGQSMENLEFMIDFSDLTLNEADGDYEKTKAIMEKEIPSSKEWVLRSTVTVTSSVGICNMIIQCHADGSVYILEYEPSSVGDLYYNPDIQVISTWAQENGWKIPSPSESLIRSDKAFWKHFWDTLIIDSEFFDRVHGKRPQLEQEQ